MKWTKKDEKRFKKLIEEKYANVGPSFAILDDDFDIEDLELIIKKMKNWVLKDKIEKAE